MDMDGKPIECPGPDQLVHLLDETAQLDQTVADHVDGCDECQAQLDKLMMPKGLKDYLDNASANQIPADPVDSIPGFRLKNEIGRGGMGVVYEAWDEKLDREVAIKLLSRTGSFEQDTRFERESKAAAQVKHPNVVPVFSFGRTSDHRPYLIMPLVKGISLRERLQDGPLDSATAARTVRQIAAGLEAAHGHGLVHRDVKSGNILLDGADGSAKLTDFGLVRTETDRTLTQQDLILGTPEYMSPEQATDPQTTDVRTDTYSLGIVLYECLTGSVPFRGGTLQVIELHRASEPVPPSRLNIAVQHDLETICLKAISKSPNRRYQTAQELGDDIQRFLDGKPITARRTSQLEKLQMWCSRNRALAISIALCVLALVAGTIGTSVMWFKSHQNATAANTLANDLQLNRDRLKDSVRKFQMQVFSDEALHWQMTEEFSTEMFNNVLDYLDEFAKFEHAHADPDGKVEFMIAANELTSDYLMVAQSALDVGSYEHAVVAARRAYERSNRLGASDLAQPDALFLMFESCRISFFAQLEQYEPSIELLPESRDAKRSEKHSEIQAIAVEASELADLGARLESDVRWKTATAISTLALARSGHSSVDADQIEAMVEDLGNEFLTMEDQTAKMVAATTMIRAKWWLASRAEPVRQVEILNSIDRIITSYRDAISVTRVEFSIADWYKATNHFRKARAYAQLPDLDKAIDEGKNAQDWFVHARSKRWSNRHWASDAIESNLWLCHWRMEQQDFQKAGKTLEDTLRELISLLKTDMANIALRKKIVALFVVNAGMSDKLGLHQAARREYFIAAQDCRALIVKYDQATRQWAFQLRLWLLSNVVKQLENAPDEAFYESFKGWEKPFADHCSGKFGLDTSRIESILDGSFKPDTPSGFQLHEILPRILAK